LDEPSSHRCLDDPQLSKRIFKKKKTGSPFSQALSTARTTFSCLIHDFFLSARSAAVSEHAPSVLVWEVTDSSRIRTSHPSGSRRWDCSSQSRLPAPGSFEPQKIVSTLFCPSGSTFFEGLHSSLAIRRDRQRQPGNGSRTEAYPANFLLHGRFKVG
jgi:hypothetical protein